MLNSFPATLKRRFPLMKQRAPTSAPLAVLEGSGIFVKFDKIWPFMESAALSEADFLCREGLPEREVCVQNGVEGEAGCGGNAAQLWGVVKMGKRRVLRQFGGWSGVGIWSRKARVPGLVYRRRDGWWRLSPLFDEDAQNFKQINLSILPLSGVVAGRMVPVHRVRRDGRDDHSAYTNVRRKRSKLTKSP
jgi:hypothetical protein